MSCWNIYNEDLEYFLLQFLYYFISFLALKCFFHQVNFESQVQEIIILRKRLTKKKKKKKKLVLKE